MFRGPGGLGIFYVGLVSPNSSWPGLLGAGCGQGGRRRPARRSSNGLDGRTTCGFRVGGRSSRRARRGRGVPRRNSTPPKLVAGPRSSPRGRRNHRRPASAAVPRDLRNDQGKWPRKRRPASAFEGRGGRRQTPGSGRRSPPRGWAARNVATRRTPAGRRRASRDPQVQAFSRPPQARASSQAGLGIAPPSVPPQEGATAAARGGRPPGGPPAPPRDVQKWPEGRTWSARYTDAARTGSRVGFLAAAPVATVFVHHETGRACRPAAPRDARARVRSATRRSGFRRCPPPTARAGPAARQGAPAPPRPGQAGQRRRRAPPCRPRSPPGERGARGCSSRRRGNHDRLPSLGKREHQRQSTPPAPRRTSRPWPRRLSHGRGRPPTPPPAHPELYRSARTRGPSPGSSCENVTRWSTSAAAPERRPLAPRSVPPVQPGRDSTEKVKVRFHPPILSERPSPPPPAASHDRFNRQASAWPAPRARGGQEAGRSAHPVLPVEIRQANRLGHAQGIVRQHPDLVRGWWLVGWA